MTASPLVWGRPPMPPAVLGAAVLCYGGVAVAGMALTISTGYVLEPADGVTRAEATTWTAVFAAALGLLLVGGAGLQLRRPWGWWLCAALAAAGALAAAYATRSFVEVAIEVARGPTYGAPIGLVFYAAAPLAAVACGFLFVVLCRPRARRWFAVQPAVV